LSLANREGETKVSDGSQFLILLDCPPRIDSAETPAHLYGGAHVVRSEMLSGVLQYASALQILIATTPRQHDILAARANYYPNKERIRFIPHDQIPQFIGNSQAIIQCLDTFILSALQLRYLWGQPRWPIVAITHDLSDPEIFRELLVSSLLSSMRGDAISCCSNAAKSVTSSLVKEVVKTSDRLFHPHLPIIPHGIHAHETMPRSKAEARKSLGFSDDNFIFLYFGRLSQNYKANLSSLLQTYAQYADTAKTLLVLAGGASGTAEIDNIVDLRQLAYELNIHPRVRFFSNPSASDKLALFSSADVFASPSNSLQESFGIALLEAMASGLPAVVTDWNGYRDIVVHEETGFLASTRFLPGIAKTWRAGILEDPETWRRQIVSHVEIDLASFGKYMKTLRENTNLARAMGQNARQRVLEEFSWKRIIQTYSSLWQKLLTPANQRLLETRHSGMIDAEEVFGGHPSVS
jgi:glycosyltransferase involved in cell wall biosynthesis